MTGTSVNVRCSGRMHKISIMPGGAFVLHNHTKAEITAERILAALGGEPCRCIHVLDAWQNLSIWQKEKEKIIPVGLRPVFEKAIALSRNRKWQHRCVDKLTTPIDVRTKTHCTNLIKATWLKVPCAHSVRLEPREGFGVTATCFSVRGIRYYVQSDPWVINTARWYTRVYRRGLAIIDNVFVLNVLSSDENGHIVEAVRVEIKNGITVNAAASTARVTTIPNDAGQLKLN